jgi:hypothetical protein
MGYDMTCMSGVQRALVALWDSSFFFFFHFIFIFILNFVTVYIDLCHLGLLSVP